MKKFSTISFIITAFLAVVILLLGIYSDWTKANIVFAIVMIVLLYLILEITPAIPNFIRITKSWHHLYNYSQEVMNKAAMEIPILDLHLELPEVEYLKDAVCKQPHRVLLTGDAGTGKTGVVVTLARRLKKFPIFFLDARIAHSCGRIEDLSTKLGLAGMNLLELLKKKSKRKDMLVVIDQCDSIWRTAAQGIILDLVRNLKDQRHVGIVLVCRPHEAEGLKEMMSNPPEFDAEEITVNLIESEHASDLLVRLGIPDPSPEIVQMARNLLDLSLIADLFQSQQSADVIQNLSSGTELWEKYRESLEYEGPTSQRHPDINNVAARLAKECLISFDGSCQLNGTALFEEQRLVSRKILVKDQGERYRFRHEKLRDYLYAWYATNHRHLNLTQLKEDLGDQAGIVLALMYEIYNSGLDPELAAEFLAEALND